MFDVKTDEKINEAVKLELVNAVKTYGPKYNTLHEAYAVLLEEFEEANNDINYIHNHLKSIWENVKGDDEPEALDEVYQVYIISKELAKEAVQIAAVSQKIIAGAKND